MLVVSLLLSLFFSLHSNAADPPAYLMAALGDSITVGTFSDTEGPGGVVIMEDEDPQSWGFTDNQKTFSWATGTKIRSHFQMLKETLMDRGVQEPLTAFNAAELSNTSVHIPKQAEQVARLVSKGNYRALLYVTLMVGANDACDEADGEGKATDVQMRQYLMTALRTLSMIPQEERIRVLVSSIPKIPDLGRAEISYARTRFNMTCRTLRDRVMSYCSGLTNWHSSVEYQRGMEIVERKNRVLQDVVLEANRRFPKLEVNYSSQMWDTKIVPEFLAFDCFHLNRAGQQELSARLWMDQPWFRVGSVDRS